MKILKFGSNPLASAPQIKEIANLTTSIGKKNIIVLSAVRGTTDMLTEIADYLYKKNADGAKELTNALELQYTKLTESLFEGTERKQDVLQKLTAQFDEIRELSKEIFTRFEEKRIIAQGEQLISMLFCEYLSERGVNARLIPALSFMRIDKNEEPDVNYIKEHLKEELDKTPEVDLYVTEGFICLNAYNEVDNLGNGGADYTASLIGAAVQAEEIQLWSDTDGIYNNNPAIVKEATPVEKLSFDEAAELSYFLERIIHPTCILPAKLANIPVRLMNILQPQNEGTLISTEFETGQIEAVASKEGITSIKIKSSRMLMAHGFLRRVFEVFENYKTAIDMITTSEVGVTVTIDNNKHLDEIVDELKKFGTVTTRKDMTLICVVGDLPNDNVGFQANIVNSLKEIPIHMISYGGSLNNISFLVHSWDKEKALLALHQNIFANK